MTRRKDVLRRPCAGPAVWKNPDLELSSEWLWRLTPAALKEIDAALRCVRRRGVPLLRITDDEFPLPTLTYDLQRIADALENGPGFALVKRIPCEGYTKAEASIIFWGICRHLGKPVSQNASGHMLGHVRDTGQVMGHHATCGYRTRRKPSFHTSGSDVLGLMSLRGPRSGALISVASSGAVYNSILERRPELVERLYRTHFLDRQEGQPPDERPYFAVPLAGCYGGELSLRYNRCALDSAQRFPEVPRLEAADVELFDLMDELAESPEFRFDLDFEEGDLLLVNNHAVFHSRTECEDFTELERKRHVLRLWLTMREGRDLPQEFWGDMHGNTRDTGRGGITPRDVISAHGIQGPGASLDECFEDRSNRAWRR